MAESEDLDFEDFANAVAEQEEAEATADADAEAESESSLLQDAGDEQNMIRSATDLEAVFDIPVSVSAVLGKSTMQVSSLLKLGRGAVIELDRRVGEAIDIYVNNRLVARGEVVVVDERLGVTMTEIIKSDRR